MRNKRFLMALLPLLIVFTAIGGYVAHQTAFIDAVRHAQCSGIENNIGSADNAAEAAYFRQEAAAAGCDNIAAPPSASPSATPTATATATAEPTDETTAEPTDDPDEPREVVFYATFEDKVGINAYGPRTAQDPSLGGISLEGMSAAQFLQEMSYRIDRDPMLAPPGELRNIKVLQTWINGRKAWTAENRP